MVATKPYEKPKYPNALSPLIVTERGLPKEEGEIDLGTVNSSLTLWSCVCAHFLIGPGETAAAINRKLR